MTLSARVSALILDGKVLPVLDAAEPVIAVGEVPAVNPEIIRNQKAPTDDNYCDYADRHPQRVQYVPLHLRFPKMYLKRKTATRFSGNVKSKK
jgi:hypothetical protein